VTHAGRTEFFRRISVLGLLIFGLTQIGYGGYLYAAFLIIAAIAVYRFLPKVPAPNNAFRYNSGVSQVGPDWIGFVLTSLFVVAPLWAAISEPIWGTIHPMSVLLWPMAVACSAFWVIGALYSSYWIVIQPKTLVISSAFSQKTSPTMRLIRSSVIGGGCLPGSISLRPSWWRAVNFLELVHY
jgi:hypothetical protein